MNCRRALLLVATAAAAAAATGGSRARNNPSPPTHPLFLFTTSSLLLSLLQSGVAASDRPPISFTQNYEAGKDDCAFTVLEFKYQGNTADGRPWYIAQIEGRIPSLFGYDKAYLYYDSNCDGKGGSHPQWVASIVEPDPTRPYDLDNDGKCLYGGGSANLGITSFDGGSYSLNPNWDWTPAMDELMVNCGPTGLWSGGVSWKRYRSPDLGYLAGCTSPYPDHTYAWSEWESTDIEACKAGKGNEGKGCSWLGCLRLLLLQLQL
eukprot:gene30227-biopygen24645